MPPAPLRCWCSIGLLTVRLLISCLPTRPAWPACVHSAARPTLDNVNPAIELRARGAAAHRGVRRADLGPARGPQADRGAGQAAGDPSRSTGSPPGCAGCGRSLRPSRTRQAPPPRATTCGRHGVPTRQPRSGPASGLRYRRRPAGTGPRRPTSTGRKRRCASAALTCGKRLHAECGAALTRRPGPSGAPTRTGVVRVLAVSDVPDQGLLATCPPGATAPS